MVTDSPCGTCHRHKGKAPSVQAHHMSHVWKYYVRSLNGAPLAGARLVGVSTKRFAVKEQSLQSVVSAAGTWNRGRLRSIASPGGVLSPTDIPDSGKTGDESLQHVMSCQLGVNQGRQQKAPPHCVSPEEVSTIPHHFAATSHDQIRSCAMKCGPSLEGSSWHLEIGRG